MRAFDHVGTAPSPGRSARTVSLPLFGAYRLIVERGLLRIKADSAGQVVYFITYETRTTVE